MGNRMLPVIFLVMAAVMACLAIATSETLWAKRQLVSPSKSQSSEFKERVT